MNQENLYLTPLSLSAEIPRLSAQARLLYEAQKPILEKLGYITNNNKKGNFLDFGCGPGILTNLICSHFSDYKHYGIDLSKELLQIAELSYPNTTWKQASVYKLPFKEKSFDFIYSSYVLIHLQEIDKALQEVYRTLKDDGCFYVINPNDSTFTGSDILNELVKKHAELYEANRYIMNSLEEDASKNNLKLIDSYDIVVDNRGQDGKPAFSDLKVSIGKMTAWAMMAYMGQRPELADVFNRCQKEYMENKVQFEVTIQIHIYQKKVNE